MTVKTGLDNKLTEVRKAVEDADDNIDAASSTLGSDADLVIAANRELGTAKTEMDKAESEINEAKSSTDLGSLINHSINAFESLAVAEDKAGDAMEKAESSKQTGYITISAVAVGAGGAAGAGFLYWRRRKGKKKGKKEEKTESSAEVEGESKEVKKVKKVKTVKKKKASKKPK